MYAAWEGHEKVVRLLIERGGRVHFECGDGFTALTLAAKKRTWRIVESPATHGAEVTHIDANGVSAPRAAERARKPALVELLREGGRRPCRPHGGEPTTRPDRTGVTTR